jgi:hypothetical protein
MGIDDLQPGVFFPGQGQNRLQKSGQDMDVPLVPEDTLENKVYQGGIEFLYQFSLLTGPRGL